MWASGPGLAPSGRVGPASPPCEPAAPRSQVALPAWPRPLWPPVGRHSPRVGAVVVEDVELCRRDQLAPVDAGLDGAQSAQDAHLLDVTHDRADV